jgi:uncharacterized SAM-binding protein YcdF (DUF218 family)
LVFFQLSKFDCSALTTVSLSYRASNINMSSRISLSIICIILALLIFSPFWLLGTLVSLFSNPFDILSNVTAIQPRQLPLQFIPTLPFVSIRNTISSLLAKLVIYMSLKYQMCIKTLHPRQATTSLEGPLLSQQCYSLQNFANLQAG